jgi:hypothetical protein
MTMQDQPENATPTCGAIGISAGEGYGMEVSQPSASAGLAAGAVGPGALAAAEIPRNEAELAPEEIETLRSLVKAAGGVDALIGWLQLHTELERPPAPERFADKKW